MSARPAVPTVGRVVVCQARVSSRVSQSQRLSFSQIGTSTSQRDSVTVRCLCQLSVQKSLDSLKSAARMLLTITESRLPYMVTISLVRMRFRISAPDMHQCWSLKPESDQPHINFNLATCTSAHSNVSWASMDG